MTYSSQLLSAFSHNWSSKRQTLLVLVLMGIALSGCDSMLSKKKWDLEVTDCSTPKLFVIENKGEPVVASLTIKGELNHDARVVWSDQAPGPDSVLISVNRIELKRGKVETEGWGDYYSNVLYVRYEPLADSTKGKLRIQVRI
jgi:hypothetical protein